MNSEKIYDILAVYKIENNTYTDCLSRVLQLFHELKGYKYNGSRFKDYILDYDKTYIKNTIIEIKQDINKAFGKKLIQNKENDFNRNLEKLEEDKNNLVISESSYQKQKKELIKKLNKEKSIISKLVFRDENT